MGYGTQLVDQAAATTLLAFLGKNREPELDQDGALNLVESCLGEFQP